MAKPGAKMRAARQLHDPKRSTGIARKKYGRWNEETRQLVLLALEAGTPRQHAAASGFISKATFYRWLDRYPWFRLLAEEAEGRFVATALVRIGIAAKDGEWTAAAWLLERRHPALFAKRDYLTAQLQAAGQEEGELEFVASFDDGEPLPTAEPGHHDAGEGEEARALPAATTEELPARATRKPRP